MGMMAGKIESCTDFFFFFKFLTALGLHCCTRAFSSCGEQGLLFVVVRGLLIAVASLVPALILDASRLGISFSDMTKG